MFLVCQFNFPNWKWWKSHTSILSHRKWKTAVNLRLEKSEEAFCNSCYCCLVSIFLVGLVKKTKMASGIWCQTFWFQFNLLLNSCNPEVLSSLWPSSVFFSSLLVSFRSYGKWDGPIYIKQFTNCGYSYCLVGNSSQKKIFKFSC